MEYTAVFEEQVALTPRDIRGQIKSIDTVLEEKLRVRLEGKCSRHGFVLSESIKILSRSMGSLERGRFTGNLLFHVQAEGKVLNPPDKTILDGEVIRKNKMGLYVNYRDAIRIIVPRDANIGIDEFESVEVGETITVEIKKSRFQVNDEYILSVGLFVGRNGDAATATKGESATVEEEEVPEEEEETTTVASVATVEEEEMATVEEEDAPTVTPLPTFTQAGGAKSAGKRPFQIRRKA